MLTLVILINYSLIKDMLPLSHIDIRENIHYRTIYQMNYFIKYF